MGSSFNRYYEVVEPFMVFRAVGSTASNTYIGNSRVFNTVYEARNLKPGDEVHILVGGDFLVTDGEIHRIRLKAPVHIFEAKYHRYAPLEDMETYLKNGIVRSIDAPAIGLDYNEARTRSERDFGECHREIIYVDRSPEYDFLINSVRPILKQSKEAGVTVDWSGTDINAYGPPSITLKNEALGKGGVKVFVGVKGALRINMPKSLATVTAAKPEHDYGDNVTFVVPKSAEGMALLRDICVEALIEKPPEYSAPSAAM